MTLPSPSLLPKCLWQSSSEFSIRDRKGKGKAKSLSDEDKEFKHVYEMADQILGALKITNTTPRLNYVIERALASDTWYKKPRFADNKWFQGLTPQKTMPSSSQLKN